MGKNVVEEEIIKSFWSLTGGAIHNGEDLQNIKLLRQKHLSDRLLSKELSRTQIEGTLISKIIKLQRRFGSLQALGFHALQVCE